MPCARFDGYARAEFRGGSGGPHFCLHRQSGSEFSKRGCEWLGCSHNQLSYCDSVGRRAPELVSITDKLPVSEHAISLIASLDDIHFPKAMEKLEPDMTQKDVKEFTYSEAVMAASLITEREKERAKERQRAHGGTAPGRNTGAQLSTSVEKGKSRDHIAKSVGMSPSSLQRAKMAFDNGIYPLVEAMDKKEISLIRASEIAHLPEDKQLEALIEAKKNPRRPRSKEKLPAVVSAPKPLRGSYKIFTNPADSKLKCNT